MLRIWITAACLLAAGCAVRKPASLDWRFISSDTTATLVPPGVAGADITERILTTDIAAGKGPCPADIRVRKKRIIAMVNRGALDTRPNGWLTGWAADAESQGCIAPGEAPKLTTRVAESLPLDPQKAFHVLYPDDLLPPVRLQVVSPILRDESKPVLNDDEQVSGNGNQLTLTARADNLIGYETALYAVQPKTSGAGYMIAPLYADRHSGGTTERHEQPATDYFRFPVDAAFFRLFIKSGETDYTALAIAASTRPELARIAATLEAGTTSCETLGPKSCIAIPRRVALNPVVPVTINGTETLVRWSADLAEAIRGAGAQPDRILETLTVSRLYAGRPTPVDFDRTDRAILRLPISGGEIISWK